MSCADYGARSAPRPQNFVYSSRPHAHTMCLVAASFVITSSTAFAGTPLGFPLTDFDDFLETDSVYIDFETDGSGAPVDLLDGQTLTMPTAEYADYDPENIFNFPTGVSFSPEVKWVNDGNLFDNALDAFASAENGIPSANIDNFTLNFTSPVLSFALWVADNDTPGSGTQPIFTIKDPQGQVIDVIDFNQGIFHDGSFVIDGKTVNYGHMGYSVGQSGLQIGSVEIEKGESIFDDLRFIPTPIPTPSTIALGAVSGLCMFRRKR